MGCNQYDSAVLTRGAVSFARRTEAFRGRLYNAVIHDMPDYIDTYSGDRISKGKAVEKATLHAALTEAAQLYRDGITNERCASLGSLYEAFKEIIPDKYCYHRFARCMRGIEKEGVERYVSDRRGGNNRKISNVVMKWLLDAMSSGKKYGPTQIHRFISELCEKYNYAKPSLSWVKTNYYKLLPTVAMNRNGHDEWVYRDMPYAGILRASAPGGQWQIDGWRLPFYMAGFKTLMIFTVMDSHSGRIVGYHVDYSENTESILKGLENAVSVTGTLPQEIVSDNHSFHKTMEAAHFKEALEKTGCKWTVTSNPRHKGIIERSFGVFGTKFCKQMYGYVGEGIRTRRRNGRTSQELLDKYHRAGKFLDEGQIKAIAIALVEDYNSTVSDTSGISPDNKYSGAENIGIPVDTMERLRLFVRKGEYTVRQGQINIVRSGVTYEYQLNKEQFMSLNNKKVAVRYADRDCIYLFDRVTDEPLGSVRQKRYAHGALCDQTADDIEILNQLKGRSKGIKTAFKQRQIDIARNAESVDPEAAYAMNAKLTPKNVLEDLKSNGMMRREAERLGLNVDEVADIPVFSEVTSFNPEDVTRKRVKDSPFTPIDHKIGTIKI